MIRTFVFTGLLFLMVCSCSQTGKSTNAEKDQQKIVPVNEALIVLSKVNPDAKTEMDFPLKDTLRLPLESVTVSSGSITSLRLKFAKNDGGRANSLDVFLPAAPQLKWHPNNGGGFELKDTKLPYTLTGDNYVPYKDALRDSETKASAYIQSIVKSPNGSALMYFYFAEITIESMHFENETANLEMRMKLISDKMADLVYGSYKAEVHFKVKDAGYSMLLVD